MLTQEDVKRLLDIAFAGINHGQIAQARTVCAGILATRPGHIPTRIALAVSHTAVGEYDKAEEILRDILSKNADDADAMAYLGLTLQLADKKDEAREVLEKVPAGTSAANLAKELLAQL